MILWIRAFHIIAFTAWFAGLFYIWRLFVYHAESSSNDVREQLAVMERRLYKIIMRPAMFVTLFLGAWLFYIQWDVFRASVWIWLKLLLVAGVVVNHYLADYYRVRLLAGDSFNPKIFRFLNEMPTLLLIPIVILVTVKPF
jgi:putative membrane protein